MSILRRVRPNARLVTVLLLGVGACYEPCVFPPCIFPLAVQVVVRADGSNAPIKDAFVRQQGPIVATSAECDGAPAMCEIRGYPGTYNLVIGAPGFQSVTKSVVVSSDDAACGCPSASMERVEVSLVSMQVSHND